MGKVDKARDELEKKIYFLTIIQVFNLIVLIVTMLLQL